MSINKPLSFADALSEFSSVDGAQSELIGKLISEGAVHKMLFSALLLNTLSLYLLTRRFKKIFVGLYDEDHGLLIDHEDSLRFIEIRDKKRILSQQLKDYVRRNDRELGLVRKSLLLIDAFLIDQCEKEDGNIILDIHQNEAKLLGIPDEDVSIDEVMAQLSRPENKSRLERAIKRHRSGGGVSHDLIA